MKSFPINFDQTVKAVFLERPNRFLVRCVADRLGIINAYLPNPGRLWELLLPGVTLYIYSDTPLKRIYPLNRKTNYTVLAVQRKGIPILIHTNITNQVARYLIEMKFIPSVEGAEVIKEEISHGRSRFDFLLRKNGRISI